MATGKHPDGEDIEIRVIRSSRRRKTIQARKTQGRIEILAPASLTDAELQPHIDTLLARIRRRDALSALNDRDLQKRAQQLNRTFFRGKLRWQWIRWVDNQNRRHGSCCATTGTIRISSRLARVPTFVLDYVLMHELAHLLEPNHGSRFWEWVYQYPKTERARGYLMALGLEEVDPGEGEQTASDGQHPTKQ